MHLTFRDGSRALRRSGFHSDAEVHLSNERTTAENTSGILPALSQPTLNVNMGGWHGFKAEICSAVQSIVTAGKAMMALGSVFGMWFCHHVTVAPS